MAPLTTGLLHREEDLPAVIYPDGRKSWYLNGAIYRYEEGTHKAFRVGNNEWRKYKDEAEYQQLMKLKAFL